MSGEFHHAPDLFWRGEGGREGKSSPAFPEFGGTRLASLGWDGNESIPGSEQILDEV